MAKKVPSFTKSKSAKAAAQAIAGKDMTMQPSGSFGKKAKKEANFKKNVLTGKK